MLDSPERNVSLSCNSDDVSNEQEEWCSCVDGLLRRFLESGRPCGEQEYFSPKLEVSDGSVGRGLFVSSATACGEALCLESACFEGTAGDADFLESACFEAWQDLEQSGRQRWSMLGTVEQIPARCGKPSPISEWGTNNHISSMPATDWMSGVVRHNGIATMELIPLPSGLRQLEPTESVDVDGLSLYPVGSLVNHSCYPSVGRLALPGWLVLRAARHLLPGAELTVAYVDVMRPSAFRQKHLRERWGFSCRCDRCLLEEAAFSDPQLQNNGVRFWLAFHTLASSPRKSSEEYLFQLVQGAEQLVNQALEKYLAQEHCLKLNSLTSQFQEVFKLTPKQTTLLMGGQNTGGLASSESVAAFVRLKNILLASYWVAPALQYAHFLAKSKRSDQSVDLLTRVIEVLQEVCPFAPLHVTASVQRAVDAAEAERPDSDVLWFLAEAARVIISAYGDGCALLEILLQDRLAKADVSALLLQRMLKKLQAATSFDDALSLEPTHAASEASSVENIPGCVTTKRILKPGYNASPGVAVGSTVTLHATGTILETGKKFWSTRDAGQQTFTYKAGVGQVVRGWDKGCLGMKVGEERELIIPADEGYGCDGFPAWGIPPGGTLHFTLECLDIVNGDAWVGVEKPELGNADPNLIQAGLLQSQTSDLDHMD